MKYLVVVTYLTVATLGMLGPAVPHANASAASCGSQFQSRTNLSRDEIRLEILSPVITAIEKTESRKLDIAPHTLQLVAELISISRLSRRGSDHISNAEAEVWMHELSKRALQSKNGLITPESALRTLHRATLNRSIASTFVLSSPFAIRNVSVAVLLPKLESDLKAVDVKLQSWLQQIYFNAADQLSQVPMRDSGRLHAVKANYLKLTKRELQVTRGQSTIDPDLWTAIRDYDRTFEKGPFSHDDRAFKDLGYSVDAAIETLYFVEILRRQQKHPRWYPNYWADN